MTPSPPNTPQSKNTTPSPKRPQSLQMKRLSIQIPEKTGSPASDSGKSVEQNDSTDPISSPEVLPPPAITPTRQRTALACNKCRNRKTKCTGDRPVCQRCSDRGLICEYKDDRDAARSIRGTTSRQQLGPHGMLRGSMSMNNLKEGSTGGLDGVEYSSHNGQPVKVEVFDQYSPIVPSTVIVPSQNGERTTNYPGSRSTAHVPRSVSGFYSHPSSLTGTPVRESFPLQADTTQGSPYSTVPLQLQDMDPTYDHQYMINRLNLTATSQMDDKHSIPEQSYPPIVTPIPHVAWNHHPSFQLDHSDGYHEGIHQPSYAVYHVPAVDHQARQPYPNSGYVMPVGNDYPQVHAHYQYLHSNHYPSLSLDSTTSSSSSGSSCQSFTPSTYHPS